MTGRSSFEPLPARRPAIVAAAAFVLLALPPVVLADLVELGEQDRISGRVTAIDGDGRLTLQSELAGEALRIVPEKVTRVVFDDDEAARPGSSGQLVELGNGDRIPGRVLSMDESTVLLSTWFAGEIGIPRGQVAALHFGVTDPNLLVGGREVLDGWSESEAWTIGNEGVFRSGGVGMIARKIVPELPERFIVRFRYEWKGNPNLRFYFADDLLDRGTADRYFLTVNSAGMELKRQSTQGRTNHSLAQDHRRPKDISPDGMDIEIRVDRRGRELHLLINGDLVDRFVDPVDRVPTGSGLMIESSASGSSSNMVSQLEVLEWGDNTGGSRRKTPADPERDTVFDRQGEHFTGTAEEIAGPAGEPAIVFRHPHAAEPLRIPLDQADALVFRKREAADEEPAPMILDLAHGGSLAVASCRIDATSATCHHPLLGELTIDRRAIRSLARQQPEADPEP